MSLTREDVAKIAHLARLALTAEELNLYQQQLSAVLEYADHLNELDLTGIEAQERLPNRRNVMREDIVVPSLSTADALFNAARTAQNQYLIQSVLDD